MKTSCHRLEIFEASEKAVAGAAKSWWQANGYSMYPPVSNTIISSFRGSYIGITDNQTRRIMQVIFKPMGTGTAVSVHHHTSRILCLVGVMMGDILERETDSFLQYIQEYVAANY